MHECDRLRWPGHLSYLHKMGMSVRYSLPCLSVLRRIYTKQHYLVSAVDRVESSRTRAWAVWKPNGPINHQAPVTGCLMSAQACTTYPNVSRCK